MLSGLFGNPGELLAPRRLSVFKLDGIDRQVSPGAKLDAGPEAAADASGADAPTGGWAEYRNKFVNDASDKFGRARDRCRDRRARRTSRRC